MANRFWVPSGGTGTGIWNGSNANNWSATSGGAGGASVPTSVDNVFFDVNSFNGAGQIVTMGANGNCLDMDWTGATNNPTISGGGGQINVYGSLTTILAMTFAVANFVVFQSTATGKTVTTNGLSFSTGFKFNGIGGGWTLQDALTNSSSITHSAGTLNTNGKAVQCSTFSASDVNTRVLNLGASVITCSTWTCTVTTGLTLNAGTSQINVIGNSTFNGGGLTYNNVSYSSGTTLTIAGSNTFNILTIPAGKTLNLTAGLTQTYTSLVANGTPASKITIQSTLAGSAATLSKSSGVSAIRNITLKDITATGGATFYALGTTNVSGNTGWAYQMLIKQEKVSGTEMALYHIDSSGVMQKVSG